MVQKTQRAKDISNGVKEGIWEVISLVALIIFALNFFTPVDNSDKSFWNRSGFTIRIDALTGCQYLDGGMALTPRLDKTGKQICGEE